MNPNYTEYRFPQIKPLPWEKVFRHRTPRDAIDFVARLLGYDPAKRPRPLVALLDPYFDELRDPNTRLPNGAPLPALFNFTEEERNDEPEAVAQLVPDWYQAQQAQQ
jgi:serine/threonine protein kinase